MPRLEKQKDFRSVQGLPFCYVCGKTFVEGDPTNSDHVPPQACFATHDRNYPLQLPTHYDCNDKRKSVDERIGQVVSLKHGKFPDERNRRLKFRSFFVPRTGNLAAAVENIDIALAVRHWISAFHAALYREPMPPETVMAMETPFPAMRLKPSGAEVVPMRAVQHRMFVAKIKINRAMRNLDRIECNNRKLVYESVWAVADEGQGFCIFALNLYDWSDLGDIKNFERRGCAGCYTLPGGRIPEGATMETRFNFWLPNFHQLDAFAP